MVNSYKQQMLAFVMHLTTTETGSFLVAKQSFTTPSHVDTLFLFVTKATFSETFVSTYVSCVLPYLSLLIKLLLLFTLLLLQLALNSPFSENNNKMI